MRADTALSRTAAAARMVVHDLGRRRGALVLMILLPIGFYVASRGSGGGPHLTAGGIGAGWSIGAASLFAALSSRRIDQRLVLDGYRPAELFTGRLCVLLGAGGVLAVGVGALMAALSSPSSLGKLCLAMIIVVVVSAFLGLAIGALVPHELEAVLLLLGVVGIQIALPSNSVVVGVLPLGGAQRLLDDASSVGVFNVGEAVTHSVGWAFILGVVSVVAWAAHTRVRRYDGRRHSRSDWTLVGLATAAAVVLLAVPLTGPAAANVEAQRDYRTVVQVWGGCLHAAGVRVDSATARLVDRGGVTDIELTILPADVMFDLAVGEARPKPIAVNPTTSAVLHDGELVDPGCQG
jgi:hypothetical protein